MDEKHLLHEGGRMQATIASVVFEHDRLTIIDQRFLPLEERFVELEDVGAVHDAIRSLAVRGAPAIGVAAAYGVLVGLRPSAGETDPVRFCKAARRVIQYLAESRPTAYNLFYALGRMEKVLTADVPVTELLDRLRTEALLIHQEDLEKSAGIAEYGLPLVGPGARILSHCNAGGLATGGGGTSLAVVFAAHRAGRGVFVYVDETRPLLQGARLTAWELSKTGVPYQVICDNMAAMLMRRGEIDMVLLGADRIARNGDFANKIGTYGLAVLARHHGIPFYTAAPLSTFDPAIADGSQIPIEERAAEEVLGFAGVRTAPVGAEAYNPAFDVTPHELVSGIITEFGVILPPFAEGIDRLFKPAKL
jgi:methylthioribose-1-phosphate isomerase